MKASAIRRFAGVLALLTALQVHAQFFPGGGGGFGQFGGGRRSSAASSRQYPNNSTVGDAVFSIDPETRNLIVISDDETAQYIQQVVENLDRPKPQVLIKVVFLEVLRNDASDIGIEGGWGKDGGGVAPAIANAFGMSGISQGVGSNAPALNQFGQPLSSFTPMPPGAGLYQVFATDYQVTLRAIAQAGRAKVLSRPSIIARNNQPATISVGQSVPLITNVRFDNFGNAINSITYQDVGIILRVTPFITTDGMIEMIISPETSELVEDRTQWVALSSTGNASAPLINQRTADTVVVTPDGQTVIIGGLMRDGKSSAEYKVPFLGDIPVLGLLFKRKAKSESNTELLIFLTPKIIPAPGEMASVSTYETGKSDAAKGLSEKELDKFFDELPQKEPEPPAGTGKPKRK